MWNYPGQSRGPSNNAYGSPPNGYVRFKCIPNRHEQLMKTTGRQVSRSVRQLQIFLYSYTFVEIQSAAVNSTNLGTRLRMALHRGHLLGERSIYTLCYIKPIHYLVFSYGPPFGPPPPPMHNYPGGHQYGGPPPGPPPMPCASLLCVTYAA